LPHSLQAPMSCRRACPTPTRDRQTAATRSPSSSVQTVQTVARPCTGRPRAVPGGSRSAPLAVPAFQLPPKASMASIVTCGSPPRTMGGLASRGAGPVAQAQRKREG
jgi:hypothetical protein